MAKQDPTIHCNKLLDLYYDAYASYPSRVICVDDTQEILETMLSSVQNLNQRKNIRIDNVAIHYVGAEPIKDKFFDALLSGRVTLKNI
ncbi:MAG: hypothetical protein KC505_10040 [Myxococcales bacterium]|nr:hypothetical protein [Myxococcales bacterium]USN49855.1 MAG: hypothetical protein H6731_06130 [Myxococcales bacterium]